MGLAGVKHKLRVHPLFLLVGAVTALTGSGGFLIFLSATLAALEHELAHALAARRYGYALDKVVLMPYGAVISGDISEMDRVEKLWVLAAGPLCNAATALAFAALWWLFPETYPYTDTAFYVSVSLFAVNLLPAYPLDGGRALRLLLETRSKKAARVTGIVCNLFTVAGISAYFIFTCVKGKPAFSAAVFAVLLFAGVFERGGSYRTIAFQREKTLRRGIEERRVVLSCDCILKKAIRFLRNDRFLVLVLYDGDEFFGEMTETEFLAALAQGDYSKTLREAAASIPFGQPLPTEERASAENFVNDSVIY